MTHPAVRLLLAAQAILVLPTSPHAANTLLLPAVDSPTGGGGTVVLEPVTPRARQLPTVDGPPGGGGAVVLEPVKPRAQPTRRLVYSCVAPGLVTFSRMRTGYSAREAGRLWDRWREAKARLHDADC